MELNMRDAVNSFYEYCLEHTELVIYGAGDVGRMVAEFMEEKGIEFDCFCVSQKPEKPIFHGHEVKEVKEVIDSDKKFGIIVAVSRKNVGGILEKLDNMECSYYYCTEFLFQLFKHKCEIAASGVTVENQFISTVMDVAFQRDVMYVCCPASVGDTLYVAALMNEYKRENPWIEKVCLILKKSHRELGKLFPAVDEVLVSDDLVETLDRYSMYTRTWRLKNYIYGHFKKSLHFKYDSEYNREDCRGILPRYRKLVLQLAEGAEREIISLKKNVLRVERNTKNIVIMPYAQTAIMLPVLFWEELVRSLHAKGCSVYTNVGSGREKAVTGTAAITESLMDTARFCENCGAVISLRSGMCDLLGFMDVKLIVVNTSKELSEEWSLKDVFAREDIYNIDCFTKPEYDKKIDEIMKIVE